MTRKEALTELLAKVEAGTALSEPHPGGCFRVLLPWHISAAVNGRDAYQGSLDAAKALHDAVLPEYVGQASTSGMVRLIHPRNPELDVQAYGETPARAWLIAILRALIAQEERE